MFFPEKPSRSQEQALTCVQHQHGIPMTTLKERVVIPVVFVVVFKTRRGRRLEVGWLGS